MTSGWCQQGDFVVPNPAAMQYAMMGDGQHMWSSAEQMQSIECWGVAVDPSHCSYAQAPQFHQQMMPQSDLSQTTPMPAQQWGVPMPSQSAMPFQMMSQMQDLLVPSMQTLPMQEDEHSLQMLRMTQMQLPQTQFPQMNFPPTPMSQVSTTTSGDSTPTDIDRCMAVVLPQAWLNADEPPQQVKRAHVPAPDASNLEGRVCEVACQSAAGSRHVQQEMDSAPAGKRLALVEELRWNVCAMIHSPHGNYAIAKAIEVVPASSTGFIVEEFSSDIIGLARHKFGIRILKHILTEHYQSLDGSPLVPQIIGTILENAAVLCFHRYGNYSFKFVLEHGKSLDKHKIACILRGAGLLSFATDQFASNVLKQAFESCSTGDQHAMVDELLRSRESVRAMRENSAGDTVLRALATSKVASIASKAMHAIIDLHALPWADSKAFATQLLVSAEHRQEMMRSLRGKLLEVAGIDGAWSRRVQDAIKLYSQDNSQECLKMLSSEFHGRVCDALKSPHAHFVMHTAMEAFPEALTDQVVDEVLDDLFDVCKSRYGYQAILCLIRHCPLSTFHKLLQGTLCCVTPLSCHEYGNWVVQEMLKRGPMECKRKLTKQLSSTNDQKNALWNDTFGRHVAKLLVPEKLGPRAHGGSRYG